MNISFSATTPQFRSRQKHVTRRGNANGPTWKRLKAGDVLMGCEKCQGLGKGGKIVQMGRIKVLEVNTETVNEIIRRPMRVLPQEIRDKHPAIIYLTETVLEGFPLKSEQKFVDMFCEMNDCEPETEVTRILFDYL